MQVEKRLTATNATVVALTKAYIYWQGLNKIQQRMPNHKDTLVNVVETAISSFEIGETQQLLARSVRPSHSLVQSSVRSSRQL